MATIMTRLRAAAPRVRVVGMTYYLPALAAWRHGTAGQVIARLAEKLAAGYSKLLARAYTRSGARVGPAAGRPGGGRWCPGRSCRNLAASWRRAPTARCR